MRLGGHSIQSTIRNIIHNDLSEIQSKNPSYSLRSYAQKIKISPSALSEILSGKRNVSPKLTERLLKNIGLAPNQIKEVLIDFQASKKLAKHSFREENFTLLDSDQFFVVSEWYYYAILSLADTDDFKGTPQWIAKRLNLSTTTAKKALERLVRLNLLAQNTNGKVIATGKQFKTTTDIPNSALRKHHYQNLDLARKALDEAEFHLMDFSFTNMAVDPQKLPQVKSLIKEFRLKLCEYFETGNKKEVYKLCIQVFPQTNIKGNANE